MHTTDPWAVVATHERVARIVARQARQWGVPFDDALQTARLGIYRAAQQYDPDRAGFRTLAKYRAIDELRALGAFPRAPRLPRTRLLSLDEKDDDGLTLMSRIAESMLPRMSLPPTMLARAHALAVAAGDFDLVEALRASA